MGRRAPAALTVAPAWGVSAGPGRAEAFGRAGPWEPEAAAIERAYGAGATIHISLEEFARTLAAGAESRERFREGGVPSRAIGARLARARRSGEVAEFRAAFARFRALDRANVLHLFCAFRPDPRFVRAFPPAIVAGPLWPRRFRPPTWARRRGPREWIWYASPSSAEAIAPAVVDALAASRPAVRLLVRTDRPWAYRPRPEVVELARRPMPASAWHRRFARAELRIVTGSRTLLEAIELGGPFLYFNGVLGRGARRRRHRPEKIQQLLSLAREQGAPADLVRDLDDFSRGRRIGAVVARAAARAGGWRRFPSGLRARGFRPPYDDAGRLIVAVAHALARRPGEAARIVADVRAGRAL